MFQPFSLVRRPSAWDCRALLLVFGWSVATAVAQQDQTSLYYSFDPPCFSPGTVDGQFGWWVDRGAAEILPGVGIDGSAALSVEARTPFSQARLSLPRPGSLAHRLEAQDLPSSLFLDAWLRLPAAPWEALDDSLDLDSARIGLFRTSFFDDLAEWHVFDGDGAGAGVWINTGLAAMLDPYTEVTTWTRITIREDLDTESWDVWADGKLLASGLLFQEAPEADRIDLFVLGHSDKPVLLDNVMVSFINPLDADPGEPLQTAPTITADLADSDVDGLPDAWELAHGFDPYDASDALSDHDGDGLTALAEYLLGTDVAKKNVWGSVADSGATVFNRYPGASLRQMAIDRD